VKKDIRKEMSSRRKKLSKADFWRLNDGILEEIKKIDWTIYHYVHLFLPIKENNEVDTFEILSFFKNSYPQLKVVVPRTHFADLSMVHVEFDHMHTVLRKNVYNIPEPVYGKIVPIDLIDVVLVPLLAFDTDGHRIGYGGGFYDRFLKNCKSQSLKIGLSLFGPEEKLFIPDLYDVKLTHCITPQKTYTF
jgi:5-formyltetrahydrofolate cyclo-ligase